MTEWIKVCETKPLKNGDILEFDYGDKNILISKAGNKVYATDRICTHAYADLSTGFMNENEKTITCPLHMSIFKLEDGTPQNLPAEKPLKTYRVKIQDNWVYILME
ncbi:MAG TPA: non-heme iron oxygenase ferredoxin subunit [Nitrososphaeraceae archaeon]|jgi:nitrite reductase/ring-hydroxylating ferredoxin subunit|nr:non-heme iron oxygenase ferredoxin subunit [Nitrososphaeraceae archaeon]